MNSSSTTHLKESVAADLRSLDQILAEKKQSSRTRLLGWLVAVPVFVVLLALAISITRGVGITIIPDEVVDKAHIEVVDGLGMVVKGNVYALSGSVAIEVSAPEFFTARAEIDTSASSNYLEIELLPKPAVLIATVTAEPAAVAHTEWFLDGEVVATGAELRMELPEGSYELLVDNPYYQLASRSLELARAEERTLPISLQPVEGSLNIASQPSNAEVRINGSVAGNSNLSLPLKGGSYEVTLSLPSHGEVTETIEINRAQSQLQRNYALIANPAYLDFQINTDNARLTLDGKPIDQTNRTLAVSAKTAHAVVLERPGFHAFSTTLTLAPGERRVMNLTLKPNIGTVRLESQPVADVLVNGEVIGQSPQSLQLPAVQTRVSFSKPGHHPVSRVITPSDSAPQLVSVQLQTELNHRLRTLPPRFVNSAGVTMQRFQPNQRFVIGAPRSEKGQRANEAERNVELNKAFYISRAEITNRQYQAFEQATGPANTPKTDVSWEQAARFSNWLSAKEGLEVVYRFSNGRYLGADATADGYRLPTETEWEWLARHAKRRQATRFTWGDEYEVPEQAGNLADESARGQTKFYVPQYNDGFAQIAPIGSFAPEASGLVDMSGNVSEWVHDFYSIPLPAKPDDPAQLNPFGPNQGEGHVVKGSSWRSGNATQLRAAYRDTAIQGRDDLGFRVARYVYGK